MLRVEFMNDLAKDGCDFHCQKGKKESLIAFINTDTGHKWVCHLSCLREQTEAYKELEDMDKVLSKL